MSHQNSVALAHHMHSPAQIIKATRRSLPTLVTIREPVGTVLSLTSRWPYVSPRQALRSYVGFYGKLEQYQDKYVLSTFEQTTQHLSSVVERVNDHFHTDFGIDNQSLKKMRAKHGPEKMSCSEKRKREALKAEKAGDLNSQHCQELLHQAHALYGRMEAIAA